MGVDGPLACPPAALGSWMPPAYHHAATAQPMACTAAMVADFYASCLAASSTQSSCSQSWGTSEDAAHQACQTCLLTDSQQPAWGPLVNYGTTVSLNVAGCIELLDPSQLACATSVQQADQCEHHACDMSCPVVDPPSFEHYTQCVDAAAAGECATYAMPAQCRNVESGPAAACNAGMSFQDAFTALAKAFCGGM
jgi:hypothetical protein